MGNCIAKIDIITPKDRHRLENANLDQYAVMCAFEDLELCTKREMERMYIAFDHIGPPIITPGATPIDNVVSIEDSLHYLQIKQSPFMDQIFTAPIKMETDYEEFKRLKAGGKVKTHEEQMDERLRLGLQNPQLKFSQFCMSMWLLSHFAIATLAFNMYDKDGSGTLDRAEVDDIVGKVYATDSNSHQEHPIDARAKQILDGMDVDHDGTVTKDEFVTMVNNYHYLLMPAFVVQSRVRSKIFGYFIDWEAEETKRDKTKYTTMVDIIKKIDETAEKQVKHLGGDINKLRAAALGEDFINTSKEITTLEDADARDHYETGFIADAAHHDKKMVEHHRAHTQYKTQAATLIEEPKTKNC
ncbi:hypothetical protein TL16_g11624 [Triparma laevis f. inornata]|uniref:EF-hand domain-containing protein n=1 Tax=Triparma laevis f. inornata TaxID=1714386 RepID=A0A9W7BGG2_9STRA|nr:hypothetical protein TL16_g11624 [Triparma laevis f. inornata]